MRSTRISPGASIFQQFYKRLVFSETENESRRNRELDRRYFHYACMKQLPFKSHLKVKKWHLLMFGETLSKDSKEKRVFGIYLYIYFIRSMLSKPDQHLHDEAKYCIGCLHYRVRYRKILNI